MRVSLLSTLASLAASGRPFFDPAALFNSTSKEASLTNAVVKPDAATNYGTWDGWGVSLCWWANIFGDRDDLADAFFSLNSVSVGDVELPGLGFNIARYNAGGSAFKEVHGESMAVSPNIPKWKQIEGYWQDYYNQDPSSSSWIWDVDAKQRSMLLKAKERGADRFELFSNSPMWWMLYNHNPSGADNGGTDNLQSWSRRNHSVYLATVAAHAKDNWALEFSSVEPLNEPVAGWWNSGGTQEGCHFDRSTQNEVVKELREELDLRGLANTIVSASDENEYDQARGTLGSFDSAAKGAVARVNTHGYQGVGGRRDLLYSDVKADGKALWNSEYGDGDASGISMAKNLNLDFQWLHSSAYVYWQALDEARGWGFMKFNSQSMKVEKPNTKFWVMAQYSRHIRPGMTILESGDGDAVVAHDSNSHKLVVVGANYDNERNITYDLSQFGVSAGIVKSWSTNTADGGERYVQHDASIDDQGHLSVHFTAWTVQTFEIENVQLPQVTIIFA